MTDRKNNFFQCSLLAALGVIILLLGVIVLGALYYNNGFDNLKAMVAQTTPTKTYVPFNPNATPIPYYATLRNRTERILFKSTWENDIYLILADGSNLTRLTYDGTTKSCPEWHPNGDRFIYAIPDPDNLDLFIIIEQSIPGGETRELFRDRTAEFSRTPKYNPDGSMLAYIANDEAGTPHVYVFDGTTSRRITLNDGKERTVSWAPDGNVVAYQFQSNRNWFYSASTIDGVQHWMLSLTPTREEMNAPASWPTSDLPNGRRYIVFTDTNGLTLNETNEYYFSMAADALPLMSDYDEYRYGYPVYAPEGNYVAYTHGKPDACKDVIAVYMGPGEIFKYLSQNLCVDETFPMSWSPDGNNLVVSGEANQQNGNLYILDLEEHEPFQLTNSDRWDACPTWAPK